MSSADSGRVRLQKAIADTGALSRRKAETAIVEGRVQVNGVTVTELGTQVDPRTDQVTLDGLPLKKPETRTVLLFYKPRRVMVTRQDPEGRRTIYDLLPEEWQRLRPVGRLDYDSEGLLVLTDDGELANRLMHPSHGIHKTYRVWTDGRFSPESRERTLRGIDLEDGPGKFEELKILKDLPGDQSLIEVRVSEGRNRFVRRMLAAVGHPVRRLMRVSVGGAKLPDSLKPGETLQLTEQQISSYWG